MRKSLFGLPQFVFYLSVVFSFLAQAQAQLQQCDGVWTNRPCDSASSASPAAASSGALSPEEEEALREQSAKRSLFHDLTMKTIKAKRDYGLEFSLADIENYCFKEATLEQCRQKITAREEEIDQKLVLAAQLQEQKRANALREEENRLQKERNEIEANKPTVIVQERRLLIPHRRQNAPIIRGDTTDIQGLYGGSSVDVTVSGSVGNAQVQVGSGVAETKQTSPTKQNVYKQSAGVKGR